MKYTLFDAPRDMKNWPETTATVIASIYQYANFRDISMDTGPNDASYFVTTFSYRVNGEVFVGEIDPDMERVEGEQFTLSYDPADPQHNSMQKPPRTPAGSIVSVLIYAAVILITIYLAHHFDWE